MPPQAPSGQVIKLLLLLLPQREVLVSRLAIAAREPQGLWVPRSPAPRLWGPAALGPQAGAWGPQALIPRAPRPRAGPRGVDAQRPLGPRCGAPRPLGPQGHQDQGPPRPWSPRAATTSLDPGYRPSGCSESKHGLPVHEIDASSGVRRTRRRVCLQPTSVGRPTSHVGRTGRSHGFRLRGKMIPRLLQRVSIVHRWQHPSPDRVQGATASMRSDARRPPCRQ